MTDRSIRKRCVICKARRDQKYLKLQPKEYGFERDKLICSDDKCGEAWTNQYPVFRSKTTSPSYDPKLDDPGAKK